MEGLGHWWQQLPKELDSQAFLIGGIPVYWYALFFLAGAALVYSMSGREYRRLKIFTKKEFQDFAFGVFISALAGGKLGFLLLYWWPFVATGPNTLLPESIAPLGLPGMSFVGGLVGVAGYVYWYAKKNGKDVFSLTDTLALYTPLAIFSGRLGSFVHGELLGRETTRPWGMYNYGETILRYPSTLYAALGEGIVLFVFLLLIKKRVLYLGKLGKGILTASFLFLYGLIRFVTEMFREPDIQIGYLGMFTLNQIFALIIMVIGVVFFTVRNGKNRL